MDIILDTNAFYFYFGVDKLGLANNNRIDQVKFNNLLSNENQIHLSSLSIYEFLARFQKSPDIIKEGLQFIADKIHTFIDNDMAPFSIEDLTELLSLSNKAILNRRIQKFMRYKVNIEAYFTMIFLLCMLAQFIYYSINTSDV